MFRNHLSIELTCDKCFMAGGLLLRRFFKSYFILLFCKNAEIEICIFGTTFLKCSLKLYQFDFCNIKLRTYISFLRRS